MALGCVGYHCGRCLFFFFSRRRRHTRCSRDLNSDVFSSDLEGLEKTLRNNERRESGKTTESEIDFGDRAVRTKILDAVGKGRIKVRRIKELEKSALGKIGRASCRERV